MNIFALQSHQVAEHWHLAEPHLRRLERKSQLISADTLCEALKQSQKQLWMASDEAGHVYGVVVTQVYPTMRGDICCIWGACGTAPKSVILEVYAHIEAWARNLGCFALEIHGRRGWERMLKGFTKTAVILEKPLAAA